MGRKWVNRETDANSGGEWANRWMYRWRTLGKGERRYTKAADEPKKRTGLGERGWRKRTRGSISESGSVVAPKSGIRAKCQQKIARVAATQRRRETETGPESEMEEREREREREVWQDTERQNERAPKGWVDLYLRGCRH